ncbi:MAG: hypothetical protein AAF206_16765 [Bacteroidota bacterium]
MNRLWRLPFLILLLFAAVFLTHCNRVKDVIPPYTLTIFPMEEGDSRVTYVEDTTFDTRGPVPDVYFKRERIANAEEDLLGRSIRRVEVFRSDSILNTDFIWKIDRVYAHYFEPQENGDFFAERIEENQRILILKFPVFEGVKWNGNLFNNLGVQEFKYQVTDTTVNIRGQTYENCVMVVQKADTSGFINDKFAYEIYAPEIGLIKKFDRTLVFDGPQGQFNPDKSRIYVEERLAQ